MLSPQDRELLKMAQDIDHQLNPHHLRFTLTKPILQFDPFAPILPDFRDARDPDTKTPSPSSPPPSSSSSSSASSPSSPSSPSSSLSAPQKGHEEKVGEEGSNAAASSSQQSSGAELDQTILALMGLLDDPKDDEDAPQGRRETDVQIAIRKFFKWFGEIQEAGLCFLSLFLS